MLALPAISQVPNPDRHVHACVAPPAPGAFLFGPGPLLQYPDGLWNHGEGFAGPAAADADHGGWHGSDDGVFVTSADVHTPQGWSGFTWSTDLHPASPHTMLRMPGYLRPAEVPLPVTHPLYGPLGTPYVDQGAFEMFRPLQDPSPQHKIVVYIQCAETKAFPVDRQDRVLRWTQVYRGFFSPDGLVRREPRLEPRVPATFLANTAVDSVERPPQELIATWNAGNTWWPITAYPVLSVAHRQTTLNEQRYLQLAQAIKCILQENSPRNPLPVPLTAQQVEQRVVVVFGGGSNGGLQAQWAALRVPRLVHGCFCETINPGVQRMFGEQDLGYAVAQLSGSSLIGAEVNESDFLHWGQYAWNNGYEIHDLSYLRHFVRGATTRPACFMVGDEDITSTGTDWIRVADGTAWVRSGQRNSTSQAGSPLANTLAWMSSENACHQEGLIEDPYQLGTPLHPYIRDVSASLCTRAVAQHATGVLPPVPPVPPQPRTSELRGLDDPHEWFFGHGPDALPANDLTEPLVRDDAFFAATQPGAAGTGLGRREAMLVRDGRVYVGSAEGVVSAFAVDLAHSRRPLVRVAQSRPLGYGAYAMTAMSSGGSWVLLVGTRRHLHALDPVTLLPLHAPVQLPWELAQPHALKVGDVLSSHAGPEIVFASEHGGLAFYNADLTPICEWSEPGITDFLLQGSAVTILSRRGVVATVTFDSTDQATLVAASAPLPRRLVEYAPQFDPWVDSPCQGQPYDLEMMLLNMGPYGVLPGLVTLWDGDEDGLAVRCFHPSLLLRVPLFVGALTNLMPPAADAGRGGFELATCRESGSNPLGDHLLVLAADNVMLFDQFGGQIGRKKLFQTDQGYWPFGSQATAIAVGELVPNGDPYQEEIVVATQSGALMWMHVQDVARPGVVLPAAAPGQPYWMEVARTGGQGTAVQPRTNRSLSATWAMARRPGDPDLHVLDQRGSHWRVARPGSVQLHERLREASEAHGWSDVGDVPMAAAPAFHGLPGETNVSVANGAFTSTLTTRPWSPIDSYWLPFERTETYRHWNWVRIPGDTTVFDGFLVHPFGGSLAGPPDDRQAWFWSMRPGFANLVQGVGIRQLPASNVVLGVWASTGWPAQIQADLFADHVAHRELRSYVTQVPMMSQEAVKAVRLQNGETVVVLGCPGGRVRILRPGTMRTDDSTPHALGSLEGSPDFGCGGSALAVRHEVSGSGEKLRIWIGTMYDAVPRPAAYGDAQGSLLEHEVAAGGVHQLTWDPAIGFVNATTDVRFPPGAGGRGAYGIVGLLVADLLPAVPGDELIVGSLSGDLLVLNAQTLQTIWRTHVPGAIGCYNSFVVDDPDSDGRPELLAAGSLGLWRFAPP